MAAAMTDRNPLGLTTGVEQLRDKWGWIVAMGVLYLVVGLIALGSIVMATVASVLVVGIMMVIAGVAEAINAFQVKTWGRFLVWLLVGLLYVIAGYFTLANPLLAAALLTLLLGISLAASGIMRIVLAFSLKQGAPWIWVAVSGAISILVGLMILNRWPVSSLYVLGLFLGVDLVFNGVSWISVGMSMRQHD